MRHLKLISKSVGVIASFAVGLSAAMAADIPANIKERGKILVAIDISHPPYGMLDQQANETGSDVDTARLLAKDMGLDLEIVRVSGANRVPFLISRKVDLVISSFSITNERKKVIAYSKPYAIIPTVIAANKDMKLESAKDLNNTQIAVARGTTADIELTKLVKNAGSNARIVRYEDEATTDTAVATGQQKLVATALSTANTLSEKNPNLNLEVKLNMGAYPMAVGLRKNDKELKEWVDEWVTSNLENGKLNAIYEKYFHQSLPKTIPEL